MSLDRTAFRPHAPLLATLAALVVVLLADGWRMALVTAFACGAIAATRIRFAPMAAGGLAIVLAALAVSGHAIGTDERPVSARDGAVGGMR